MRKRFAYLASSLAALGAAAAFAWAADDKPIPSPPAPLKKFTTMKLPVAAPAVPSALDPFALPPDYRCPDGSFDEDALVAQQKRRLGLVNDKLNVRFTLAETPHFLVFSDAGPALSADFVKWGEALYGHLCREFNLDPKGRLWNGKCVLAVFAARPKFEAYARTFDGQDVREAGAYFCCETFGGDQGPNLIHICIPTDDPRPQKLQELLAHEGTHAFFQLYCRPHTLPLWLHEGLAEYMTVASDPSLAPDKGRLAARAARRPGGIGSIFTRTTDRQLSLAEYSVAYSLVDYLQKTSREKFRRMVDLLKDGKTAEAALQEAYGFDTAGLQRQWVASVTAK